MKMTSRNASRHTIAGGVNWGVLAGIAGLLVIGLIARRVGGFEFAPDAPNLFLAKLPVLFLVALLIERTGEIILTIWRGGEAVRMEAQLDRLTALKAEQTRRNARLAALPGEINTCVQAIQGLTGVGGKEAELKDRQSQKAALEQERAGLDAAKAREEPEINTLEAEKLPNGEPRSIKSRTDELTAYKNETRSVAMTITFTLALLISACGFRAVEGLVALDPAGAAARAAAPAVDPARLKELTQQLTTKVRADRESLEKTSDPGAREIIKRQQDDGWAAWLEGELKDKVTAAKPVAPAPGATSVARSAPAASQAQVRWFRFFDVLLTAGLLAGGADPLSRIMKLLRDFLDQRNKDVKEKDK